MPGKRKGCLKTIGRLEVRAVISLSFAGGMASWLEWGWAHRWIPGQQVLACYFSLPKQEVF